MAWNVPGGFLVSLLKAAVPKKRRPCVFPRSAILPLGAFPYSGFLAWPVGPSGEGGAFSEEAAFAVTLGAHPASYESA